MERYTHGRRRRVILLAALTLLLVAMSIMLWREWNAHPVVAIPSPVLPHPNAFDDYVRAADMILIADDAIHEAWGTREAYRHIAPSRRLEEVVRHTEATTLFLAGSAHAYRDPHALSWNAAPLPHYATFRHLARYFAFAAHAYNDAGDWAGALDHGLNAVHLGTDMQHGTTIIGMLVAIRCQAYGRREVWETVEQLAYVDARAGAARMEHINARAVSYLQVMEEEKWWGQATLLDLFATPGWRAAIAQAYPPAIQPVVRLRVALIHKRRTMELLTEYYDAALAMVEQPYPDSPPEPAVPRNIVCHLFAPLVKSPWVQHLANQANNHLLTTALALRAYHLTHGTYPPDLDALVRAGYLATLPHDPFTAAAPLRYRQRGETYLLYSIGPDGIDDQGTPIDAPGVSENSLGDIVAGMNIW